MPVPANLTIKIEGLPMETLLSDWRWLVPKSYTPILMTAFGDLFLRDEGDCIHMLDLMWGQLKQVATSRDEFDRLCEDREQRRNWFLGFLFMELKRTHGDLAAGKCFSCKIPLSLSGEREASNFEPMDLQVHYSVLGQLQPQTRHLPPGTKIDRINLIESQPVPIRKSLWQKVRGWI